MEKRELNLVRHTIKEKLGLKVNMTKSKVVRASGLKYLTLL